MQDILSLDGGGILCAISRDVGSLRLLYFTPPGIHCRMGNPTALCLGLEVCALFLLNETFASVRLDEQGIWMTKPIGKAHLLWRNLERVERAGVKEREITVRGAQAVIGIYLPLFEQSTLLRNLLLNRNGPSPQAITINVASDMKLAIGIILAVAAGIGIFGGYISTIGGINRDAFSVLAGFLYILSFFTACCILALLYRLEITRTHIKRTFIWGTEKTIQFSEVHTVVLAQHTTEEGFPTAETLILQSYRGSLTIASSLRDFGWIKDTVLANCKMASVQDLRRSNCDFN